MGLEAVSAETPVMSISTIVTKEGRPKRPKRSNRSHPASANIRAKNNRFTVWFAQEPGHDISDQISSRFAAATRSLPLTDILHTLGSGGTALAQIESTAAAGRYPWRVASKRNPNVYIARLSRLG
jgi:hypothetical protein